MVLSTPEPYLKEWHYRIPDYGQWRYEYAGWEGHVSQFLIFRNFR
jgi:hypothetical protein